MKKHIIIACLTILAFSITHPAIAQQSNHLKLVFLRHGEKPDGGDNLNCKGLNRALQLPKVLKAKFGIPAYIYVPALGQGGVTKHTRMFQTISPFAIKYNIAINTGYDEKDYNGLAGDLKSRQGTIIIVWEHTPIAKILRALGVNVPGLHWPDNDYDGIWIVTFDKGKPVLTIDKEGLKPSAGCGV